MALAFHAESPVSHVPADHNKIREIFNRYLLDPTKVMVVVAKSEHKTIGCIVALCDEMYFSRAKMAGELIWYVDLQYRNSRAGIQLFKSIEFWAKRVGASFVHGVKTEGTTDVSKIYLKNGYHLYESTYVKELK